MYSCTYMKEHAADKGYFSIGRITEDGSITNSSIWGDGGYDGYDGVDTEEFGGKLLSKEEAEKIAGITGEEAQAMGDAYVKKLGDDGLQCSAVRLCTRTMGNDGKELAAADAGWRLYYTRTVDGFPTTYEMNPGGGLESMDSTNDVAGYEKLTIVVNQKGLQCADFYNWSQVGEKQVDSVQMKTFPEIADIFQKMLKLEHSDMGDYVKNEHFQVKEARLGYSRIYDPGKDIMQGLLVPVWDFFGIWENTYLGDGEEYDNVIADPYQSFLTINAVDGTIIKRDLGY